MTVYELIQALSEYDADDVVEIGVTLAGAEATIDNEAGIEVNVNFNGTDREFGVRHYKDKLHRIVVLDAIFEE